MPVKLATKLLTESAEARIEIIPLIDIMFFLLAAFMLVSLSMVNIKSVKVNLPAAVNSTTDIRKDFVHISVDKAGFPYLGSDAKPIGNYELIRALTAGLKSNPNLHVIISADRDTHHGDVIQVLDLVRSAGIDKVAFEIHPSDKETP